MNKVTVLLEEIKNILLLQSKEVLTVKDFCALTSFSQNYVYSLVEKKAIPFFKPLGKTIFFKREDVTDFLTTNKVDSKKAIEQKTSNYLLNSKF